MFSPQSFPHSPAPGFSPFLPPAPVSGLATGQHGSTILTSDPMGMHGAYVPVPQNVDMQHSILDQPLQK